MGADGIMRIQSMTKAITSIGWSGGLSTGFFADPDGAVGVLLTQVELGEEMWPLIEQFQSLHKPS